MAPFASDSCDTGSLLEAADILSTHARREEASALLEQWVRAARPRDGDERVIALCLAHEIGSPDLLGDEEVRQPLSYSPRNHGYFVRFIRSLRTAGRRAEMLSATRIFLEGGGKDEEVFGFLCAGLYQTRRFDELGEVISAYGEKNSFFARYYGALRDQFLNPDTDYADVFGKLIDEFPDRPPLPALFINYLSTALQWREPAAVLEIIERYLDKVVAAEQGQGILLSTVSWLIDRGLNEAAQDLFDKLEAGVPQPDRARFALKATETAMRLACIGGDNKKIGGSGYWRAAHKQFETHCAHDFDQALAAVLLEFQNEVDREATQYFDVRIDPRVQAQLLDLIASRIANQQPFSFLRLGDGETFGLPLHDDYGHPLLNELVDRKELIGTDNQDREHVWWGSGLEPDARRTLQDNLVAAMQSADLLGMPNIFRLCRDYRAKLPMIETRHGRGTAHVLLEIIRAFHDKRLRAQYFTDERAHQFLFPAAAAIDLSNLAGRTVVISCFEETLFHQQGMTFKDPVFIQVPPHKRVMRLTAAEGDAGPILPEAIENYCEDVKQIVGPGDLVFVGAGIAGKIFLHLAKENGAVALDVGSAVDYWLNIKTRSPQDIVDLRGK